MKSIYMRNLCNGFLKKKKLVIIGWIIIVFIFGCAGLLKVYSDKSSPEVSEETAEYEENVKNYDAAMQEYDDTIAIAEQNITLTQTEVDNLQKYIDESVFMKIDPKNVQIANIRYMITVSDLNEGEKQIEYLTNAFSVYITGANLKKELADELGNITVEYLEELYSCSVSENIFSVTVKHSDMEQARIILEKIEKKIDNYQNTLKESMGDFELSIMDTAEASRADSSVEKAQNSYYNDLRTYNSTLIDMKAKLVSQQTSKANYIKEYKPKSVAVASPKKVIAGYGILGIIAGFVIPFVLYALWYTISGKIKGKEEMVAAGLNVLSTYSIKSGFSPTSERIMWNLKMMDRQNGKSNICLYVLGESDTLKQVCAEFEAEIKEHDMGITVLWAGQEKMEELEACTEHPNCVFLVESGKTTYAQVEEQVQFCDRFHMSIWGCIVIE